LAQVYASDNDFLKVELQRRDELISKLEMDVTNLQAMIAWSKESSGEDELIPATEIPISVPRDAVNRAKKLFGETLLFGSDVAEGVDDLSPNAGPPDKIFRHLEALSELSSLRLKGSVGKSLIGWLIDNGVPASPESETITNNQALMRKRQWDAGGKLHQYELHTKPNEATGPQNCVRIYFDWVDDIGKIVVGWVGRHPDE